MEKAQDTASATKSGGEAATNIRVQARPPSAETRVAASD
jgi:hypothetical protein